MLFVFSSVDLWHAEILPNQWRFFKQVKPCLPWELVKMAGQGCLYIKAEATYIIVKATIRQMSSALCTQNSPCGVWTPDPCVRCSPWDLRCSPWGLIQIQYYVFIDLNSRPAWDPRCSRSPWDPWCSLLINPILCLYRSPVFTRGPPWDVRCSPWDVWFVSI